MIFISFGVVCIHALINSIRNRIGLFVYGQLVLEKKLIVFFRLLASTSYSWKVHKRSELKKFLEIKFRLNRLSF